LHLVGDFYMIQRLQFVLKNAIKETLYS